MRWSRTHLTLKSKPSAGSIVRALLGSTYSLTLQAELSDRPACLYQNTKNLKQKTLLTWWYTMMTCEKLTLKGDPLTPLRRATPILTSLTASRSLPETSMASSTSDAAACTIVHDLGDRCCGVAALKACTRIFLLVVHIVLKTSVVMTLVSHFLGIVILLSATWLDQ